MTKLYIALDTPHLATAESFCRKLAGLPIGIKLGLEFFYAQGPEGVRKIQTFGFPLFLDLKLHDIPNTVAGAIKSLLPLQLDMLTLHTCGGLEMLKTAQKTAREEAEKQGLKKPFLLGVTILTSLSETDQQHIGFSADSQQNVQQLARLAQQAKLDGIVCSAHEVAHLKSIALHMTFVTPGIRLAEKSLQDQKRVMTPESACDAGADVLVIGRPVTQSDDPATTVQNILALLDQHQEQYLRATA